MKKERKKNLSTNRKKRQKKRKDGLICLFE